MLKFDSHVIHMIICHDKKLARTFYKILDGYQKVFGSQKCWHPLTSAI